MDTDRKGLKQISKVQRLLMKKEVDDCLMRGIMYVLNLLPDKPASKRDIKRLGELVSNLDWLAGYKIGSSIDGTEAIAPAASNKKENTMRPYNNERVQVDLAVDVNAQSQTIPAEQKKTDFLLNELGCVREVQVAKLYSHFNMGGPSEPKSPKDFVDRIKNGLFTFNKHFVNEDGTWRVEDPFRVASLYNADSYFAWNIPGEMPDEAGHTAATEKLDQAYTTASRLIQIMPPADGLKALQDFEAATFH